MAAIKTLYGEIEQEQYEEYCKSLVGKVYKLLPMKEEGNKTINKYIQSVLVELNGGKKVIIKFSESAEYVSLVCSISGLADVDDMALFRSKIFECISICKKLM